MRLNILESSDHEVDNLALIHELLIRDPLFTEENEECESLSGFMSIVGKSPVFAKIDCDSLAFKGVRHETETGDFILYPYFSIAYDAMTVVSFNNLYMTVAHWIQQHLYIISRNDIDQRHFIREIVRLESDTDDSLYVNEKAETLMSSEHFEEITSDELLFELSKVD